MSRRRRKKEKKRKRSYRAIVNRALSGLELKNYRTEEFIMTIMESEKAIYETFIMTRRNIVDEDVRSGLRNLIRGLRTEGYESLEDNFSERFSTETYKDLVAWNIMRHWVKFFAENPLHNDSDLAGCLSTIIDSIKTWITPRSDSQGYLYYLEGFMSSGLGVDVWLASEDGEELEDEETDESRLLDPATNWLKKQDSKNWKEFKKAAEKLIRERNPGPVIHVCQYIIGCTNSNSIIMKLMPLLQPAFRLMGISYRPPGV